MDEIALSGHQIGVGRLLFEPLDEFGAWDTPQASYFFRGDPPFVNELVDG